MLIYILKSAACLAILLIFYKLFLEKENMHVFKRFYLLGSLLFALIVPTIIFSEYVIVEPMPIYESSSRNVNVEAEPNIPPALEADVLDIAPLLWIVYFMGMFFFGIKFLRNLIQIFRRIRRNPKYKNSSFIQVLLQEKIPPHTFFKYIFLNKSKFESKEIPKEVLLHEETHARQKHSLDVVFIELLQVIFWVNPLIYFFKKAIKLNHEFLADSAVLNKNVDTVTYQNTLLSFLSSESAKKYQPTLPNSINYSSIKKRFTIMKSQTSKKAMVFRSFLLLPLLAILLVGFSETKLVRVPLDNEPKSTDELTSSTLQEGATTEQVAEYNALAEKYNLMISAEENIWIKKGDVERLEYLHNLMSEEQRENAEPFPDFPEPPEPPMPPNSPDEEEIIEMEREMVNQEKAMEQQERAMEEQEHAMKEKEHAMREQEIETKRQEQKMEEYEIETESRARTLSQPPPPPEPESPLNHVIKMAKKNATFYFEGKKITSDRAIEILKKNKSINIETKHINDKQPVVKLSTEPIKIGSTHNFHKKRKGNLKKVELVTLHSKKTIKNIEISKRLMEFKENYNDCFEFYFDDQPISENEAMHIYANDPKIEISQDDLNITRFVTKC